MPLTMKEALDAYQAQNAATDKLWAYFSAASLAVAGYVITQAETLSPREVIAIAGAYGVFCITNNGALAAAQSLLVSLAEATRKAGDDNGVPLAFRVFSVRVVRCSQACMALAVVLGSLVIGKAFG